MFSFNFGLVLQLLYRLLFIGSTAGILYVFLFYGLRFIFRKFERDFALVTLYVSAYPALLIFVMTGLRLAIASSNIESDFTWLNKVLNIGTIVTASYWSIQLFNQVVIYYLKELAEKTEIMWDDVLIPLLEGIIPITIILTSIAIILQFCFDVDLTGIWVALGGASFILGFAAKDILANFFSGIVLLIDTPFQFGDVLRLEQGQLAIIQKVGLRVTKLYLFEEHTEAYIPNSVLQNQILINMSRPIVPIYYSRKIILKPDGDLDAACQIMQDIIYAHPDTIGDINTKLECIEKYFSCEDPRMGFREKRNNGRARLIAENKVNQKLEEVEQSLEIIDVTLKFVERGGLSKEDIETIQQEYKLILDLLGFQVIIEKVKKPDKLLQKFYKETYQLQETNSPDSLISSVREWYRLWLKDPDFNDRDRDILPTNWEYKIELLRRKSYRLLQKIMNPSRSETRLDDYVRELAMWLKTRFKQLRSQYQEPQVGIDQTIYGGPILIEFCLKYYVDNITLENYGRGERVNTEIYREVLKNLKNYIVDK